MRCTQCLIMEDKMGDVRESIPNEVDRLRRIADEIQALKDENIKLLLKLESARNKLEEVFDYAAHNWSEWGSRAEGTVELLEELEQILAKDK